MVFFTFYAILRSIPHKAGGILAMGGAIAVLFLIPFNNTSNIRNTTYRPIFKLVPIVGKIESELIHYKTII
jgi:quinol-cytochrome oxidoreductase complex cytochrome b subunit